MNDEAAYRHYLSTYVSEEERRASQEQFDAAVEDLTHLLGLLATRCRDDEILRDATLTVLQSTAAQLRSVERACRRIRQKLQDEPYGS